MPCNNTTQEKTALKPEWKEESERWGAKMGTGTKNLYFLFNNVPVDTGSVAKYSSFIITILTMKQQEEDSFTGSYSN